MTHWRMLKRKFLNYVTQIKSNNMEDKLVKKQKQTFSIKEIEKFVCDYRRINPTELHDKSRKAKIKETRQIVQALSLEKGFTQQQIADYYHQTHSAIGNSRDHISSLCFTEKLIRDEMDLFRIGMGLGNMREEYINQLEQYRNHIDKMLSFLKTQTT